MHTLKLLSQLPSYGLLRLYYYICPGFWNFHAAPFQKNSCGFFKKNICQHQRKVLSRVLFSSFTNVSFSDMESKPAAGKLTSEELAAIEDEEVLNKMVSHDARSL